MPKTKVEVYDKNQLIYPFIESDHVTFSNGMKVSEMLDQSISMPTVIHEDLSFKVGVGDQDVSSAIVDSSVSEMTIKGKTYQNILPEPSTHVLTNNKEMFKVNEGLDSNVEIVDGVSKSAILSGNTLVNLMTNCKDEYVVRYHDINNPNNTVANISMMKPNTEYTLFYKAKYRTEGDGAGTAGGLKVATSIEQGFLGTGQKYTTEYMKYVYKFTTSSVVDCFVFASNGSYFAIKECVLLEGDYTQEDIPFFEGMQSVKMPVLTTTGKNLFDFEKTQTGYLGANPHGLNAPDQNNKTSDYIRVKPNTTYTYSFDGFTASQVGNDYWTGWYYYTSPTEVSKKNMNRQVVRGSADTFKTVTFTTPSDCYYVRIGSRGLALSGAVAQLEESSIATSYEPFKSNILSTPEEVVLRKVNGVEDTLNLNTGEYVQHIGETVLDGTNIKLNNTTSEFNNDNFYSIYCYPSNRQPILDIVSDKLITANSRAVLLSTPSIYIFDKNTGQVVISFERSKLLESSINGVKEFLQQNPIKLQYSLATPVVKTVDLSSSGNWEKIVYSGASNESWSYRQEYDTTNTYCFKNNRTLTNALLVNQTCPSFSDNLPINGLNTDKHSLHINGQPNVIMKIDKKLINEPTDINLRQYLQQNPVTVWYQTTTHQSSTQVKEPIFFNNGHIIQSSGADNSLIPTLDYQAKTSNSYVMDLMKANTRYTMKAKSANGTFTIDGTSYGAGTNGTFTTPSSMTNKFLVMSNKTNEEVMILEGDVTDKTIPYFKGIKSAFEDESKIEVLSTGKNIFDGSTISGVSYWADNGTVNQNGGVGNCYISYTYVNVKSGQTLYPNHTQGSVQFMEYDSNKRFIRRYNLSARNKYTVPNGVSYLRFSFYNCGDNLPQIEFNNQSTSYEPYKQNVSKIPLLSQLRSLPNGVCDELIIDRMKNKATLIQRVEAILVTSVDDIRFQANLGRYNRFFIHKRQTTHPTFNMSSIGSQLSNWCPHHSGFTTDSYHFYVDGAGDIMLFDKSETLNSIRTKMSQSPFVALHQLATPIVTEVDLEGFPYIYKDGHIFLNGEITPTTEIIYSINQSQQISASNEDIIRHEKELTYLQKLIAQYVQVDYESALLSLKV